MVEDILLDLINSLGKDNKKSEKDDGKNNAAYFKNLDKGGLIKGKQLEREKKYAEAIEVYRKVIELFEKKKKKINKDYYFRIAYVNGELKNTEEALKWYQKYITLNKKDASSCNNIGLCYCAKGMHKKEFEFFDKALKINPKYILAYRNKAICYRNRKMYKKALKVINKAIKINPKDSRSHEIKGEILEFLGKREEAVDSFETTLELDPNNKFASGRLNKLKKSEKGLSKFFAQIPERNFKDVAGLNGLKRWSKINILGPIHQPKLAKKYNKRFGGGIMMYGPPGCGKTYFVSALAGQGKINLIKVKISSIMDLWVGNTEKNIEKLFREARKKKPCIVFVDEIDGLGGKRYGGPGNKYSDQAVNQFLMEVSELEEKKSEILVIGATNTPWNVDDALKRSGRFGKSIYVPEPDEEARKALFKMYLKGLPIDKEINYGKLARTGKHLSAADIRSICEEAAGMALEQAYESKNVIPINQKMLEEAVKRERSDVLEWYNTATKMINEHEMEEFYPELYSDVNKIRKKGKGRKDPKTMFR